MDQQRKRQEIISLRLHDLTKHLFSKSDHELEDYYYLEDKWTDIVDPNAQVYMTNKDKLQQRALWEFLVTERNYINKLRLIVQVFLQSFVLIQGEGELEHVIQKDVFGNINEVFLAHDTFWTNYIKPVLEDSRMKKTPISPSEMLVALHRADRILSPYLQFCILQDGCLKNIRHTMESSDYRNDQINLKCWLIWCQNLPQCKRTSLADLMTAPMQRLTRYAILLKRICSETVDDREIGKLTAMTRSVEQFVSDINKAVRVKQEKVRLDLCLKNFDYYSVMDAGCEEVKWIAIDFLRMTVQGLPVNEPRCILKQGPMKMIEKKGKTEQVIELFLFTDLIAIARTRRSTNKLTIIRQLYYLDKVKLLKSQSSDTGIVFIYLDEAGLLATTFVLEVNNNDRDLITIEERRKKDASYERDVWVTTILKAKKIYEKARNGQGSTLDYFEEEGTQKCESLHKTNDKRKNRVNSTDNTNSNINILLEAKTKTNDALLNQTNCSETLPSSSTHDDPTTTWVLSNKEKRGSIPIDDPYHIEKSFKSNKSESDVVQLPDVGGVSVRTSNSVPELSNTAKHCTPEHTDVRKERSRDESGEIPSIGYKEEHLYTDISWPKSNKHCVLVEAQTQTDFG